MGATTTQSGVRGDSFAPELVLQAVPKQSLIEFEGGGGMLSREILGEMLAVNEAGVLNARVDAAGASRGRVSRSKKQQRTADLATWTREHGRGPVEEGKRAHKLCRQKDMFLPSRSKSSLRRRVDLTQPNTASWTERSHIGGCTNVCGDQQRGGLPCMRSKAGNNATAPSAPSPHVNSPSFSAPCKRAPSPVKLYNHDHNPRLLRALLDESAVARLATGGGDLRTNKEALGTDCLRSRLRLVCNHAKETPETQMFQSRAGSRHREVLGELYLDRMRNALMPRRKEQARDMPIGSKTEAKFQDTIIDFVGQQASTIVGRNRSRRCRPYSINERGDQPTESGVFMTQNRAASPACPHEVPRFLDSGQKRLRDWSFTRNLERHPLDKGPAGSGEKRWTQTSGILITCNPPLCRSLTPTACLRRYLSSPRPFSADCARVAWEEIEATRGIRSSRSSEFPCHFTAVEESAPRWPVLFVVGSSRPRARHPLSLHALPLFDDETINLLAQASGEPKRKVRAMAGVLSGLDFRLLQTAVKRLCCAHTTRGVQVGIHPSSYVEGRRGRGCSDLVTQAWMRSANKSSAARSDSVGPRYLTDMEGKEVKETCLILPKESAMSALTSGFLGGVFADDIVRDILRASGPFIAYKSTCIQQKLDLPPLPSQPPPFPQGNVDNGRGESVSQQRRTTRHAGDATDIVEMPSEVSQEATAAVSQERGVRFSMRRPEGPLPVGTPDLSDRAQPSGRPAPPPIDGPHSTFSQTAHSSGRPSTAHEEQNTKEEEGVLLAPLVRVISIKFRIHNLAVRHRGGNSSGDVEDTGVSCSDCRESLDLAAQERTFVRGLGASRASGEDIPVGLQQRRPSSTGIIELGLPPLRRDERRRPRQAPARPFTSTAWIEEAMHDRRGGGGCKNEAKKGSGGTMNMVEEKWYEEGGVTSHMLRRELKVAETAAARLGTHIARKLKAWRIATPSSRQATTTAAIVNAATLTQRQEQAAPTSVTSTRAKDPDPLLEVAKERVRVAVDKICKVILRRGWNAWVKLTRCRRSLEAAELFVRLVGATALGSNILKPLLRRRKRTWLRRWASVMHAERMLEVQAAAVELQRVVRGFLGRAQASRRRRDAAAIVIQRVSRGRAGRARSARRERFLRELQGVQTIERKRLELVCRRKAIKLLQHKRRERASTKAQSAWRALVLGRRPARLLRRVRREEVSAIVVQRLWRGCLARGKVESLLETKHKREAAIRIQTAARGRRVRRIFIQVLLRERAASRLCSSWRCSVVRKQARFERSRLRLAQLANPLVRGLSSRLVVRRIREERRKKNWNIISACIVAQKMFRKKQGRLRAREELALRRCAAVELQRMTRGLITRRVLGAKDSQQIASWWTSAIAVQRVWRGLRERRRLISKVAEIHEFLKNSRFATMRRLERRLWNAAFAIQSAYRRYRASCGRRARAQDHELTSSNFSGKVATAAFLADDDVGEDWSGGPGSASHVPGHHGVHDGAVGSDFRLRSIEGELGQKVRGAGAIDAQGGEAEDVVGPGESAVGVKFLDDPCRGAEGIVPTISEAGLVPPTTKGSGLEDVGGVDSAAMSAQQSWVVAEVPPTPISRLTPTSPAGKMPRRLNEDDTLPEEKYVPAEVPPPQAIAQNKKILTYYEAKLVYLTEQEAAHGDSAAKIQTMFRGSVARRETKELREKHCKAEWRRLERVRAAVMIQAGMRRHAATLRVARERMAVLEAERREEGRLAIQCALRCYLAKCRLWHLRGAERARLERLHRMAAQIQARVRGWKVRDVWRKFFKSRVLFERERRRNGAQQIQSKWSERLVTDGCSTSLSRALSNMRTLLKTRSKLACSEAERRRSLRDEALLAKELECHLKRILGPAMEHERRHAYAVRLQCWWRGILAMKVKARKVLALGEQQRENVEADGSKAALVIQCHWQGYRARCLYHESYASLFREKERKKSCTECQREYATRKCGTCLDKFCECCWARMHSKGTRRFHHWEPFGSPVSYEDGAYAQHGIPVVTSASDSNNYYAQHGIPVVTSASDSNNYNNYDTWAVNQQVGAYDWDNEHAALYQTSEVVGGETSADYVDENWRQPGWQQRRWPQQGLAESDQAWQDPSSSSVDAYGGADSYDVPDGSYPAWTSDPTALNGLPTQSVNEWSAGGLGEWAVATPQRSPDTSGYYFGHDDSVPHASAKDQGLIHDAWNAGATATGLGAWTTPETSADADDTYCFALTATGSGGSDGNGSDGNGNGIWDAVDLDGDVSAWQTSGESWYYNEYGQRFCGDWVEYFDESAQAAYFYNAATGEASWVEPTMR